MDRVLGAMREGLSGVYLYLSVALLLQHSAGGTDWEEATIVLQTKLSHKSLSLASFPKAALQTLPLCHPLIKIYGAISSFPSQLLLFLLVLA